MSIAEDVEKLILEVTFVKKNLKAYRDRNLKDKLWHEVCESVFTHWSELPAEQKTEKVCQFSCSYY